ncbi:DUF1836 domain-containing protein [Bacillus dakarensis]|uniref:DUF1836 domain-containing protein n=1 Tax=Robertmurraya dakarensis TaxID=1926278 RepID=UPI0009816B7F|nr:DUF1836 domain-containing protein [Bacillus dakarensis]
MNELSEFLEKIGLHTQINLNDIPDIDLYMDQVIQLFEKKFNTVKRNDEEKILTKTMINNYAKAKLFFPIKNKKYSREHLILISLIYQLKGTLSINDIKEAMQELNEHIANNDFPLEEFYDSYLKLSDKNEDRFKEDVQERAKEVKTEIEVLEEDQAQFQYLEKLLLILSLVNISNIYRRTAERLVDEIVEEAGRKDTK